MKTFPIQVRAQIAKVWVPMYPAQVLDDYCKAQGHPIDWKCGEIAKFTVLNKEVECYVDVYADTMSDQPYANVTIEFNTESAVRYAETAIDLAEWKIPDSDYEAMKGVIADMKQFPAKYGLE